MRRRKTVKNAGGGKDLDLGARLVAPQGSRRIWEMQVQNKTLVQATLASQMPLPIPVVAGEQSWEDSEQNLL